MTHLNYGMNASFFNPGNNALCNIVYQDGKCIGSGVDADDGYRNSSGTGLIYWTGSQLKYAETVLFGSSSLVPTGKGTWAQGGYNLYLCDKDWKDKFLAQEGASEVYGPLPSPRTGILINTSTANVYFFVTQVLTTVSDIRRTMMEYAGISEGGSSGSWKAILTDGGLSTQLYCASVNIYPVSNRKVPQIIALINKN